MDRGVLGVAGAGQGKGAGSLHPDTGRGDYLIISSFSSFSSIETAPITRKQKTSQPKVRSQWVNICRYLKGKGYSYLLMSIFSDIIRIRQFV